MGGNQSKPIPAAKPNPKIIRIPAANPNPEISWIEKIFNNFPKRNSDADALFDDFMNKIVQNEKNQIIITSIGKQSLGKSHLLNQLFGSEFETKNSVNDGKCTNLYNSYNKCKYIYLLDAEGFGADDHIIKRDNVNISIAFIFSKIILLHLDNSDICGGKFIKYFAYSY